MTKVITFFSQKGGVGKSTLTTYLASALQHSGNRVLVLDADFPQHSMVNERRLEMMRIRNSPDLQSKFDLLEDKSFEIRPIKIQDILVELPAIRKSGEYKCIFIDLPGTLNLPGLAELIDELDSVIIPMEHGLKVFSSAMDTIKYFYRIKPQLPLYILWNRVHTKENPGIRVESSKIFTTKGNVQILGTLITSRVSFNRESVSLFPPLNDELLKLRTELDVLNII